MAKQTIAEQISAFEATRAAKAARMSELMEKSAEEGVTLDKDQEEEYDGIEQEVKSIDAHLVRLSALEKTNRENAKPVENATEHKAASTIRSGARIEVRNLPKGTAFARYAMAVAAGKGSFSDTVEYAKRWDGSTPEVSQYIKAVAGSSTALSSDSPVTGWGGELVQPTNLASEFVDLLRPATILGRLTGVRNVPFNVRIAVQTGGSTVNWVGEAAAKPVGELLFSELTMGYNKVAGIVVITDELVRLSSPSAEEVVRRDLVEKVGEFLDDAFVNPSYTATSTRPASITNGVASPSATGTAADDLYHDMNIALATFDNADMRDLGSVYVLTTPALARGISTLRNALGQFEFTSVSMAGGTLMGFPVIVSSSVPSGTIIVVKADEIFMADDGQVRLDASNQATLDMSGGNTPTFNLWQKNATGIRAERWITWAKRRADAVAIIDTAAYAPS